MQLSPVRKLCVLSIPSLYGVCGSIRGVLGFVQPRVDGWKPIFQEIPPCGHPFSSLAADRKYIPPDFTIIDGDDDDQISVNSESSRSGSPVDNNDAAARSFRARDQIPDFNIGNDYDDFRYDESRQRKASTSRRNNQLNRVNPASLQGASWMERNAKFSGASFEIDNEERSRRKRRNDNPSNESRTFRQDFRGTRVFVQGLPPDATWQQLKDHFREAGEVVFASVSSDPVTGRSKGHGIVQYETTEMAQTAISIMRNYPLNGYQLYVREDIQEAVDVRELKSKASEPSRKGPTPPSKWKCANEDNTSYLEEDERRAILQMIKARDQARRRRNYDAADTMRERLKEDYGVHLDDRLQMWWTNTEGNNKPPQTIYDIKGDGRWGDRTTEWRQIPTTPENDACVDPNLVNALLKQRDIARREKDFATADSLLEEARSSPDGDLYLRIHDESRTWRIWTEAPPPRPVIHSKEKTVEEQCIDLVAGISPEKVDEVKGLLSKYPGREWNILKKLKQRYGEQ